jgi:hypothetical protein
MPNGQVEHYHTDEKGNTKRVDMPKSEPEPLTAEEARQELQDIVNKHGTGKAVILPNQRTQYNFQDAPNSFSIYEKWNGYEYRLSAPSLQELCALHKTWKQQFKDTTSPDESK